MLVFEAHWREYHDTIIFFFFMLNIKEDILKNAGNQTVDGPHWRIVFLSILRLTVGTNNHFWVNYSFDDRIFIFEWTIPLS